MMGDRRQTPSNRIVDLLKRRRAEPAPTARPARVAGRLAPLTPTLLGLDAAFAFEFPFPFQDLRPRATEPDRTPWLEGLEYRYRLGSHRLALSIRGVSDRQEAAVGRAEAEFALVVEGPLLVIGCRFGAVVPWSWSAPYNWHFAPASERVVPDTVALTPESFSRLWSTLWVTLVDAEDGRVRVRRAVALRPEFTVALHAALRAQASRPFQGAAADRALDGLRYATSPLAARAVVRTQCAAVSERPGRSAPTRARRVDALKHLLKRTHDGSRPRHHDHHRGRVLDAYSPYPGPSPRLPGGPRRGRLARGGGRPSGGPTGPDPRLRPWPPEP